MQPRLTLHVYRSPAGVDWTGPRRLALSVLKSKALRYVDGNRRFLGHLSIDLCCAERRVVAGVACRNGETAQAVLRGKAGYGVLFGVFPGRLETQHELLAEIAAKQRSGLVHSITYLLAEESAAKMFAHYDRYVASGGDFNYGFPLNTLTAEGGGCSAFALSFLQVAGLADPAHLEAWSGSVWVPSRLIGPHNTQRYAVGDQPLHAPDAGGKAVTLLSVLLGRNNSRWAQAEHAEARSLEYYDPDTMFRWIEDRAALKASKRSFAVRRRGRSLELVFDYRARLAVVPWRALVLLGPTGSGKTPLGALLEKKGLFGRRCVHFDFGEDLRTIAADARAAAACGLSHEERGTVGRLLQTGALLERATFHIALKVLDGFAAARNPRGEHLLVLNGLPRHTEQAQILHPRLRVEQVVMLDCAPEAAAQRIRLNRGGDRGAREDDHPESIRKRLERYRARTAPLAEFYARLGARVTRVPVTAETTAAALLPQLRPL